MKINWHLQVHFYTRLETVLKTLPLYLVQRFIQQKNNKQKIFKQGDFI